MRIDVKLMGSACAVPDFSELRAALMAAQAATPTARAARRPAAEALFAPTSQLFGIDGDRFAEGAARNRHRFTDQVPGHDDGL